MRKIGCLFFLLGFLVGSLVCIPNTANAAKQDSAVTGADAEAIMKQIINNSDRAKQMQTVIQGPAKENLEIKSIVLAPGVKTYLVTGKKAPFFGASSPYWWVYEKTTTGFLERADFKAWDGAKALKTTHNGYKDIQLTGYVGMGSTKFQLTYMFDGIKYVESR
jgi:hypothetical protein